MPVMQDVLLKVGIIILGLIVVVGVFIPLATIGLLASAYEGIMEKLNAYRGIPN